MLKKLNLQESDSAFAKSRQEATAWNRINRAPFWHGCCCVVCTVKTLLIKPSSLYRAQWTETPNDD